MTIHRLLLGRSIALILILCLSERVQAQFDYSCKTQKCENGGTCIDTVGVGYGFKCDCPLDFIGTNCQLRRSGSGPVIGGGGVSNGNSNTNNNPASGGGSAAGEVINGNKPAGGNSNSFYFNYSNRPANSDSYKCLNGGTFVRIGMPCVCPNGLTGNLCEKSSSGFGNVDSSKYNSCKSYPCLNYGMCKPTNFGYTCMCTAYYSGPNCEYKERRSGNVLGASLGSSFSSLLFIGVVAFCIYQCCLKRNHNGPNGSPRAFPFSPNSFFNPRSGGNNPIFGGNGGYAHPMRPGPAPGGFPMSPNGGGLAGYPTQPPPPAGIYQPQQPGGGAYPMPIYQQNRNQFNKPQDPDEVFRVNAAPPSYDEVTADANSSNANKPTV